MKRFDSIYDIIGFGKHEYDTLEYICLNDHQYLQWAIDNNIIQLSNDVFEAASIYMEMNEDECYLSFNDEF